jgi:hypothetical protein
MKPFGHSIPGEPLISVDPRDLLSKPIANALLNISASRKRAPRKGVVNQHLLDGVGAVPRCEARRQDRADPVLSRRASTRARWSTRIPSGGPRRSSRATRWRRSFRTRRSRSSAGSRPASPIRRSGARRSTATTRSSVGADVRRGCQAQDLAPDAGPARRDRATGRGGRRGGRTRRCRRIPLQCSLQPAQCRGIAREKSRPVSWRPGEEIRTASQPVRDLSPSCAAGDVTGCHCVANGCNGPLQAVAPADPIAEALDRTRATWIVGSRVAIAAGYVVICFRCLPSSKTDRSLVPKLAPCALGRQFSMRLCSKYPSRTARDSWYSSSRLKRVGEVHEMGVELARI